jgi:hypothetical protein
MKVKQFLIFIISGLFLFLGLLLTVIRMLSIFIIRCARSIR